jgi:hypothetical protein
MTAIFAIGVTGGSRYSTPILVIACSLLGLHLLFKGIRNDIMDATGIAKAPRWLYFAAGIALQAPVILYAYFLRTNT